MPTKRAAVKFFLCTGQCVAADNLKLYPNSHIIGQLRYVKDEGHKRVTALLIYKQSVAATSAPTITPKIQGRLLGDVRGFGCLFPGCQNSWDWHVNYKTAEILIGALYTPVERKDQVKHEAIRSGS